MQTVQKSFGWDYTRFLWTLSTVFTYVLALIESQNFFFFFIYLLNSESCSSNKKFRLRSSVQCCFTTTETDAYLGRGAKGSHLDFRTNTQILPQDTNTASATHSEQTNNTATHRAADRRPGCSTCKQCQQPTLVDQSEIRKVTSPPPSRLPPSWPVGLVWGRKQHVHCHIQFGQRSPRGSCCSDWRHVFTWGFGFNPCQCRKEIWTWILTMPSVTIDYAFIQWHRRYNNMDSDWNTWGCCGLTLWQVWRPTRQRQKWTDTVASVETNATETEVDWHCGKCGDQRDRDRRWNWNKTQLFLFKRPARRWVHC